MNHKGKSRYDRRATKSQMKEINEPHFSFPLSIDGPHFLSDVAIGLSNHLKTSARCASIEAHALAKRCMNHTFTGRGIDERATVSESPKITRPYFLDYSATKKEALIERRATKARLMGHKIRRKPYPSLTNSKINFLTLCLLKKQNKPAVFSLENI